MCELFFTIWRGFWRKVQRCASLTGRVPNALTRVYKVVFYFGTRVLRIMLAKNSPNVSY